MDSGAYVPGGANGYVVKGAPYAEPEREPPARLAAAATAAEVLWKKTVDSLADSQIRANQHAFTTGVRGAMHRGSDTLAASPKEARSDKGIDAVMKAALPGVQEEEGRWRSQLRVEQEAQLRANAEVMRNVVLLHTANPSQAWGVAAGEAQRLKRAAEARIAERHGGAKSAGGAAAGLAAGAPPQEKQARLAQLVYRETERVQAALAQLLR